jgi:RNA-directed DNA polymerase
MYSLSGGRWPARKCATSDPTPMNHSNKSGKPPAESEEGRPLIKENTHQPSTLPTQSGVRVSQGLAGVRRVARERKEMKFTALLHHLTLALIRDSFYALKRKAAPGVDGVTWQEYETGLEGRLADLHSRVHRGAYRAQPSRRVYIPKPDGRQRPLGIAALEDKIVQQAVVTILNQIYEEDFRGFSYGFRPGRSQHQALDALYVAITRKKVNWILDCRSRRKTRPFWRVKRSHGVGYAMAFCRAEKAVGAPSCYFLSFFAASASVAC